MFVFVTFVASGSMHRVGSRTSTFAPEKNKWSGVRTSDSDRSESISKSVKNVMINKKTQTNKIK